MVPILLLFRGERDEEKIDYANPVPPNLPALLSTWLNGDSGSSPQRLRLRGQEWETEVWISNQVNLMVLGDLEILDWEAIFCFHSRVPGSSQALSSHRNPKVEAFPRVLSKPPRSCFGVYPAAAARPHPHAAGPPPAPWFPWRPLPHHLEASLAQCKIPFL